MEINKKMSEVIFSEMGCERLSKRYDLSSIEKNNEVFSIMVKDNIENKSFDLIDASYDVHGNEDSLIGGFLSEVKSALIKSLGIEELDDAYLINDKEFTQEECSDILEMESEKLFKDAKEKIIHSYELNEKLKDLPDYHFVISNIDIVSRRKNDFIGAIGRITSTNMIKEKTGRFILSMEKADLSINYERYTIEEELNDYKYNNDVELCENTKELYDFEAAATLSDAREKDVANAMYHVVVNESWFQDRVRELEERDLLDVTFTEDFLEKLEEKAIIKGSDEIKLLVETNNGEILKKSRSDFLAKEGLVHQPILDWAISSLEKGQVDFDFDCDDIVDIYKEEISDGDLDIDDIDVEEYGDNVRENYHAEIVQIIKDYKSIEVVKPEEKETLKNNKRRTLKR